jgi:hypothetical protein
VPHEYKKLNSIYQGPSTVYLHPTIISPSLTLKMTEKSDTGNGSANFSIDEIVAAVVATLHAMELNCPVEHGKLNSFSFKTFTYLYCLEGTISAASGAIAAAGKKSSPVGDNGKLKPPCPIN